jgi:2,3-bisphosphoglycerate-dependent phosphoglycerate mutase
MQLFFIRHGQSANNLLWEETGGNHGRSDDPELTKTGHVQAKLLGQFLKQKDDDAKSQGNTTWAERDLFCFSHLYTSLMVRSVATGTYLSRALGIPLRGWPEIHECGGIFEENKKSGEQSGLPGKPRSYFVEKYNDLILPDTLTEEGWWNRPFEAYEDRPIRARQVLESLIKKHGNSNDRVAIVSHGGFYMELVRVMFRIDRDQNWFLMNNTGVSRFDFNNEEGGITLAYHNRTEHLSADLVT